MNKQDKDFLEGIFLLDYWLHIITQAHNLIKNKKPLSPISMIIDKVAGYDPDKKYYAIIINAVKQRIKIKKKIGYDYSGDECFLNQLKGLNKNEQANLSLPV